MNAPKAEDHRGSVVSVRGSVVDIYFPSCLPAVHHALHAGNEHPVIIEVVAHQSADTVRGIALTPTQGLFRGAPALDTGQPLRVPVGRRLLGRTLLLAGPALSLPNMLVIRSILGTTKTLAFVSLVVVMATGCGLLYGMLVSA